MNRKTENSARRRRSIFFVGAQHAAPGANFRPVAGSLVIEIATTRHQRIGADHSPCISNREIPRLEANLTHETSTRTAFLIAKKSHIADSLFSDMTRARRSATARRVVSNRLRCRLEFDVTPSKQTTARDSNRPKLANYAFLQNTRPWASRRPARFYQSALRFQFSRIFSINVCSFGLGTPAGSLLFGGTH
jgi:sigma54-dependent transcription regulator